MPNRTDWMEPELAFRLRDGRPVFHCYRHNEVNPNDMMRLVHHFTLSADADDEQDGRYMVDVRDYVDRFQWGPGYPQLPEGKQYDTQMAFSMAVLQRAYDAGMLKVPT